MANYEIFLRQYRPAYKQISAYDCHSVSISTSFLRWNT